MKAENAVLIVRALQAAGAQLAGLYAQTSMRIEKGFRAMGHELDGDVTPVDVGLDGAVAKKRKFIGSEAVAAGRGQEARKEVATLIFTDQDATPLGHEPVWAGGKIIGQTTSAAYGHRIDAPVALAYVDASDGAREVEVDIAGVRWPARLQAEAAFDPMGTRMKA